LHGLMRVRGFVQDDGHIFCREDDILPECAAFTVLLQKVYADFGFTEIIYKVATRPEKRVGSDESWDKAEHALMESLRQSGVAFDVSAGEGAFYGPKIEYSLKDAIGRVWQCGTMQVDFNMPVRLGAEYVDEHSTRRHPVMLHRAIVGSLERFIGILIENYAGRLPFWLAPRQVVVASIVSGADAYVEEVAEALRAAGLRAEADTRNEKINYKVREHSVGKVPVILAIGPKEVEARTVSMRRLGEEGQRVMPLDEAIAQLAGEAEAPDLRG
jgi:threonyl-tRNA synthetase